MREHYSGAVTIFLAAVWLATALASAALGRPRLQEPQADVPHTHAAAIPTYHKNPPKGALPDTQDPKQFPDAVNQNVYALAARIKKVLYQQPCYCMCDHEYGHQSLLDCYVSTHAAVCSTCRMEAVYAYEQSLKGKSAAEIRKGIINGDWRKVDMAPYNLPAGPR
ncbi:MAG: CYCXC family (seleno)protein [Terriglobia bacterium]